MEEGHLCSVTVPLICHFLLSLYDKGYSSNFLKLHRVLLVFSYPIIWILQRIPAIFVYLNTLIEVDQEVLNMLLTGQSHNS